ncbi:DUF1572 domain-containing protein [Oceanobacillus halophilus]|uniref:DUF1572 domain-containing protein n=1 Tax=Oceanobacillus halophilus TaxID=930130 RepID=A0A495A567_9BACI|nr:DUF1572 domain-containing protein [Oceanobacillus halophilus]RKQ34742.1 DUF1572 domain-containing protein [Oceanobacillus halophilus]
MKIGKEYLRVVQERFMSVKSLGDKTINQLSEEEIHWEYNEASNCVAVIVKHLNGNMQSRWTDFLSTDGEKTNRDRDSEFENTISSKQELMAIWENGWNVLFQTLEDLKEEDLLKEIYIRGERHSVMDAIERQMVHYASHIGQIVYIGKQVKGNYWKSLSIPKGKSASYLEYMKKKQE